MLSRRQIAAVVAGNAFEFYDFVTYAFFAVQISRAFFPGDAAHSLLGALATFAVGFLTRPIGGWVIGRYADRAGRTPAMLLSIALMGVAMLAIALIPPYSKIGPLAPVAVLIARLLQGFAVGGEMGPNTAYLLEAAPPRSRGLYVSLQYAAQHVAILASGVVGVLLSRNLSEAALGAWGWRVAFLLGVLIIPLGIVMRRTLPEEPPQRDAAAAVAPSRRLVASALSIFAGTTVCAYAVDYLTTFAQNVLQTRAEIAFAATAVLGITGVVADVAAGLLSDRYGAQSLARWGWSAMLCLLLPTFLLMTHFAAPRILFASAVVLQGTLSFSITPGLILVSEALPAASRASSLALLYALSISIFGGSTQFCIAALIAATGSPLAPAFYMMVAAGVGFVGTLAISRRAPLPRDPLLVRP